MPTWLIVVLIVVGIPVVFYTFVYAQTLTRRRVVRQQTRRIMKDIFGE